MSRLRAPHAVLASLLVVVALATAACGGASGSGGGAGGGAAGLAPGNVLGFVAVDTDVGSSALTNAEAILNKFPSGPKLLAQLKKSMASGGTDVAKLQSSIGPELDIAFIDVGGRHAVVGFTKPSDVSQFESTLKTGSSPTKYEEIGGWVVFSDSQAGLDAVKNRTSNLSDASGYQDAKKSLPSDTLATAYVDHSAFAQLGSQLGKSITGAGAASSALDASKIDWLTAALTSHDQGFGAEVHVHTTGTLPEASSAKSLESEIPAGALVAASGDLSSLSSMLTKAGSAGASALAPVESALGVSPQDLLDALSGPAILYVKPGAPLPEVTIVVKPADAAKAQTTIATLAGKLTARLGAAAGAPTTVKVGDVTLQKVALGPVSILFGVVDGQVLLTDSETAVAEIRSTSNRLADDDAFKAAEKASGLSDSSEGFLYVDLKDAIPAVEGIAALAQTTIPANVEANLKPLKSFVLYGSRNGQTQTFTAFLQTN